MLVKLADREKVELQGAIKDGRVISSALKNSLQGRQSRSGGWDGFIHPSSLDWNKSVESQIKKLKKVYQPTLDGLMRMEVGNIIHEYIQDRQHNYFFNGNSDSEVRFEIPRILFRGTADQIGTHKHLGSVLLEYKSVSSYQRDKAFADKVDRQLDAVVKLNLGDDWDESYNRLCMKYMDYSEPKSDHLTQAFTYVLIKKFLGEKIPDWVCICYIRKETLDTMEFWYKVSDHTDLIKKAYTNYKEVYKVVLHDPEGQEIRARNKEKYGAN